MSWHQKSSMGQMSDTVLQAMESKLLMGGKNIVDHTNEQQRALEQKRQELLEQAVGFASLVIQKWQELLEQSVGFT